MRFNLKENTKKPQNWPKIVILLSEDLENSIFSFGSFFDHIFYSFAFQDPFFWTSISFVVGKSFLPPSLRFYIILGGVSSNDCNLDIVEETYGATYFKRY